MTTLLFVHGRSQQSPPEIAADPARLRAYVETKKRDWLGGLSRGLLATGLPPITDAVFPFYGNEFADRIRHYEAAGGRRPDLELGVVPGEDPAPDEEAIIAMTSAVLDDLVRPLGFDAARELEHSRPELADKVRRRGASSTHEFGWDDALRIPVLRAGLQFLARKTGVPATVIQTFLSDVAYYLELANMRDGVIGVVEHALHQALPDGGPLVVVGHSLGSVVAHDLLTRIDDQIRVDLFVTAGSPLGLPVVQANLLGKRDGEPAAVPPALPDRVAAWVNAYDVRDVVALIHPIGPSYRARINGQIRDERTENTSDPHSIADYLSDPDIARPIGEAMTLET